MGDRVGGGGGGVGEGGGGGGTEVVRSGWDVCGDGGGCYGHRCSMPSVLVMLPKHLAQDFGFELAFVLVCQGRLAAAALMVALCFFLKPDQNQTVMAKTRSTTVRCVSGPGGGQGDSIFKNGSGEPNCEVATSARTLGVTFFQLWDFGSILCC